MYSKARLRLALSLLSLLLEDVASQNASDTQLDMPSHAAVLNDTWFWSTPPEVDPDMDITPLDWDKALTDCTFPVNLTLFASPNASLALNATSELLRQRVRKRQSPQTLRIMPLGASITVGEYSSPKDGYRKHLRNWLRQAEFPVNMVGSQVDPAGSMANGAEEGVSGKRIREVHDQLTKDGWLNHKPNVVLIHVGTNNCVQAVELDSGADDMRNLVKDIFAQVKDVHVIMSTLGPLHNATYHRRCQTVLNPGTREVYAQLLLDGNSVSLVDFGDPNGYIHQSDIRNEDGIHPTEAGYAKYATLWYYAIQDAYRAGKIGPPESPHFPDKGGPTTGKNCNKVAGKAYGPDKTQFGKAGADDGFYSHASRNLGPLQWDEGNVSFIGQINLEKHFFFTQIYGIKGNKDRRHIQDDLVFNISKDDKYYDGKPWGGTYGGIYKNLGGGKFSSKHVNFDVDDGPGCNVDYVHWGDVNNDGLDDYICIDTSGNMYVSINRGGARFEYIGLYKQYPGGFKGGSGLIADVDGDGRADYCITATNGDISCWRNGGTDEDKPTFWQEAGVVFTGKSMGDQHGTRFVDINGDGRSDWIWIHSDTGATRIFTNGRGRYDGLAPYWREAVRAHPGTGEGRALSTVKFARLFPRTMETRADYVRVRTTKSKNPDHPYHYQFEYWENLGTGGTKEKADGNRYCDMRVTGRDDLLWLRSTGDLSFWPNDNKTGHLSKPWGWGKSYSVLNVNADGGVRDRRGVHLADWSGDGLCDVIYHDITTGRAEWWKNVYRSRSKVAFQYQGFIPNAVCSTGIGVGPFDLGLRFADIDGDKPVDWLCMEPDGRTHGYLNHVGGVLSIGQIKKSVGHERANHRWADGNGDGRADFLWVNSLTGDTEGWQNEGIQQHAVDGSRFLWAAKGKQYDGQTRGGNQYYPEFDGDGRADLHKINPVTNLGESFFNICPGGGNRAGADDSNTFTGPKVPADPNVDHGEPWGPSDSQCHQALTYCDMYNCTEPGEHDIGDDGDVSLSRRQRRQAGGPQPPKGPGGNGYTSRDPIAIQGVQGFRAFHFFSSSR